MFRYSGNKSVDYETITGVDCILKKKLTRKKNPFFTLTDLKLFYNDNRYYCRGYLENGFPFLTISKKELQRKS